MLKPFNYTRVMITSFWTAVFITAAVWLITGWPLVMLECIKFGAVTALVVIGLGLVLRLFLWLRLRSEDRRIRRIMYEQGVTPELLGIMLKRVNKAAEPSRKAEAQLDLASYLSEGCCYERSFEILGQIDPRELSESSKEEYFNIYVYTNLMVGDVSAARSIYNSARYFFDRARMRSSPMPVLHTLGALEYAEGDYLRAENYFTQALAYAVGKAARCDCEMFLSLCYLKTGRLQYAVRAAKTAAKDATTVYQRRSIEGLRAQLEQAAAGA